MNVLVRLVAPTTLTAALLMFGACQTVPRAPVAAAVSVPRSGADTEFVDQLDRAPQATWADVLAGAAMLRGVPLSAMRADASLLTEARALGLLGEESPDLNTGARVLDVATVVSRALGEPVTDDAGAHRALIRQRALGIWPGPREAWEPVSGRELLGVLAGASDHLAMAAEAAGMSPAHTPWDRERSPGGP